MSFTLTQALLRNVLIEVEGGKASGVIVASGAVMTNFHALHSDSSITADGKEAEIVFVDPLHDLILLSVPTRIVKPIVISNNVQVAEMVYYVGNPGVLKSAVIFGRVIAKSDETIYCDNAVQCGASGSGLYSENGWLVGMVEAMSQPQKDDDHFGSPFTMCIRPEIIQTFLTKALNVLNAINAYASTTLAIPTPEDVQKYGVTDEAKNAS